MAGPTQTPPQGAPRINATRPENLTASSKRTSKAALLAQYAQLLPLKPASPTYVNSLLSTLHLAALSPPQIDALWDDLTQSVWVQNDAHMMQLWKQGFFGKGFLSRSEPSWKRRVQNRRAELEGREKKLTSEEITALRRIERKGTKLAKKLERDAERLLAASTAASAIGSAPGTPASSSSALPLESTELEPKLAQIAEEQPAKEDVKGKGKAVEREPDDEDEDEKEVPPEAWQAQAEHSQLQPEEAFFLVFALGSLALRMSNPLADPPTFPPSSLSPPESKRLSILEAFRLFLRAAAPTVPPPLSATERDPRLNRLDSPFLLSYAAYHHYRSMGWVVRSGVKFCVDWVLYGQGGPVGGHAEFAVVVLPTYVDPRDAATNPFRSTSTLAIDLHATPEERAGEVEHLQGEGERKNSWRWFHTINRVCSGVKKTLVLLHVVIPPLSSLPQDPKWIADHPAQALARFEMREVVVRRFLAGRMRD
ncbi:tRNA splicing endonuclease subunit SEN2 [Rhodotorula paludigena]|uniref:tRNA splicing endonuclease subunit SEN2 n=1 Tax=Rhodotorula paludigena TaxID=86838 RepID=UPI00316F6A50